MTKFDPVPESYPKHAIPVPRFDDPERQPACRDHPHKDWWLPIIVGGAGFSDAVNAATVCWNECPVFLICSDYSRSLKPNTGVWASRLWRASPNSNYGRLARVNLLPGIMPDPYDEDEDENL